MERFSLAKRIFDLNDKGNIAYLSKRYKNYYTQRIEGHDSCILYFDTNLVFAKRIGNKMMIVSTLAPEKRVRDYWCTFPLQKLSRKIFDLFYKRKYILL